MAARYLAVPWTGHSAVDASASFWCDADLSDTIGFAIVGGAASFSGRGSRTVHGMFSHECLHVRRAAVSHRRACLLEHPA